MQIFLRIKGFLPVIRVWDNSISLNNWIKTRHDFCSLHSRRNSRGFRTVYIIIQQIESLAYPFRKIDMLNEWKDMFWLKLIRIAKVSEFFISYYWPRNQCTISNQNNQISNSNGEVKKKERVIFMSFQSLEHRTIRSVCNSGAVGLIRCVCCVFTVFLVHQHGVVFFLHASFWWTLLRFDCNAVIAREKERVRDFCTKVPDWSRSLLHFIMIYDKQSQKRGTDFFFSLWFFFSASFLCVL